MLKGSLPQYLKALEDEIERVEHQMKQVPWSHNKYLQNWQDYRDHLENLKVEACSLYDFEDPDETGAEEEIMEAHLLHGETDAKE